jgi:hypothetical protein
MAFAARRENYRQTAKRTFSEMIAELQKGHKPEATPQPVRPVQTAVVQERAVPVALPEAVRQKAADFQRRQNQLVSHVNRNLPVGCHVLAWSILPADLFQSELGRFLMMAFDFHACGPENTLLLPATAGGANYLSMPRHPLVTVDAHLHDASNRIKTLRDTVTADHRRTVQAMQNGDMSEMFKSSERQLRYRQILSDAACDIAETAFGQNIWASHETHFRELIQSL